MTVFTWKLFSSTQCNRDAANKLQALGQLRGTICRNLLWNFFLRPSAALTFFMEISPIIIPPQCKLLHLRGFLYASICRNELSSYLVRSLLRETN